MASLNKCCFIGNLGADPETRYTANGDAVCNFSIACTESWKEKQSGEKKEQTEWVRVSFFGKVAEICGQYLKKGSQVYVEGSLRTRKWQDKDGQDRYTTEIRGDEMKMLGGRPDGDSRPQQQDNGNRRQQDYGARQQQSRNKPSFDDLADDIPFN